MTIWDVLKNLKYNRLKRLFFLALRYPIMIYPTLKATAISYRKSKRLFPTSHGKKGKANAFRHSLWNVLICIECYKWRKNEQRIIAWAKIITDKHEELSPNLEIDRIMDMHNNRIGRELYELYKFKNIEEIIPVLYNRLEFAEKILNVEDVSKFKNEMVYISDEG